MDKRQQVCEYCHKSGHSRDTCFKLHGTPDWYKEMDELRKKSVGRGRGFSAVTVVETKGTITGEMIPNIADIVRTEMKKLMHDETPLDPLQVHYAQLENFAGNTLSSDSIISSSWIVDGGATNHICAYIRLFCIYDKLANPLLIHLPNGHTQSVSHIGTVRLTSNIILTQVLHIPNFSVNLQS
ncbi:UNVERIFIED_CONTAM: hypothetical protein Sindi_2278200, partial [Sesamum indicum]